MKLRILYLSSECSSCLLQASAQACSLFENLSAACASYSLSIKKRATFLQRGRIACNAKCCISTVVPSVCPSVRPSHAGIVLTAMKIGSCGLHCEVAKTLLIPTMVEGRRSLPHKIWAQSDPPPPEKRWLWPISAYNVSTVRASEKVKLSRKSTKHFPMNYRRSAYVTPKSPIGWLKK